MTSKSSFSGKSVAELIHNINKPPTRESLVETLRDTQPIDHIKDEVGQECFLNYLKSVHAEEILLFLVDVYNIHEKV